jgi:outer membrane protein OmpA-like peptidoglycan-associated protein
MKSAILAISLVLGLPIAAHAFQATEKPVECSPVLKACEKPVKWLADKKECSCFACEYGKPTQHTGCTTDKETKAELLKLDISERSQDSLDAANRAVNRIDTLTNTVANLDNYQPVAETSVEFGFDKDKLTPKAKAVLDQLATGIANTKGYLIIIEGRTDSVEPEDSEYDLVGRREKSVVQYLAAKYNVPAHKIYVVALPGESNQSPAGRTKNRKVDVRLMANTEQ